MPAKPKVVKPLKSKPLPRKKVPKKKRMPAKPKVVKLLGPVMWTEAEDVADAQITRAIMRDNNKLEIELYFPRFPCGEALVGGG